MFSRTLLLISSASHANISSKMSANQSTTNITFITTSIPTREQLLKRTESLKNKVAILSKSVNRLLSQEVDDFHWYKRRACIILVGINPPPLSQHETNEEITKKDKTLMVKNLNFSEEEADVE